MKMRTRITFLATVLLITSLVACKKNLDPTTPAGNGNGTGVQDTTHAVVKTDTTAVSYPQNKLTKCPGAPDYGDSIIYVQPSSADYIITPINHPDTGTYMAWPQGMVIDKNTGAINVTKSEGGLRYNIGFVKKGTTDTCLQTLILGGVSYEDSLYILNNDQRYAQPYFDADPTLTSVCDPSNGPGGNTCAFDINGKASSQHVIIDHNTGVIDLKKTASLAFGLIPLNGTTVTTTMAYQVNDKSNMAPQQITLTFIYYNKKSDVPADLLAMVSAKLNKILGQLLLINLPGAASQQMKSGNPRPPIIIVTRSA
jgi:hypothetical protein